jgi:hypothetical protein
LKQSKSGKVTSTPCKVVARMFTNIKTADAQINFFQTLIDKSKFYGLKKIDLKGVVLVCDMDPIMDEVATKFGMIIFWDHRHVNQAIIAKLKGEPCLNIVLYYMGQIRNSLTLETAKKLTLELKNMLLTDKKTLKQCTDLKNPNFNKKAWKYLNQQYFASDNHYNKLCKWTVKHLDTSFWLWSQAIESRHNKDLNIWNSGTTKMSIPECVLRYQQIDKAELRMIYLHFLEAQLPQLKKAFTAKKSNKAIKFVKSMAIESSDVLKDDEVEPNIISRHKELHEIFKNVKEEKEFVEVKTVFNKPNKSTKRTRRKFELSETDEII